MNIKRRAFIRSAGNVGCVAIAAAVGLLKPTEVLALEWNKAAFEAKGVTDVLRVFGVTEAIESKDIQIKAPDIAENGAVVPIEVTSKIAGTRSILLLVEKNAAPLAGNFELANGADAYI